jgi:hypothetical protein
MKSEFKTEAELCEHMIKHFAVNGVKAYREISVGYGHNGSYGRSGWDILFVHPEGMQFGIQAKMTANLKVIAQAIDDRHSMSPKGMQRPDYIGVLIPFYSDEMSLVANRLCVRVFWPGEFYLTAWDALWQWGSWGLQESDCRIELPDFVPDLEAGIPAPIQMTPWKIKAIKIGLLLVKQGFLTRKDFHDENISPTLWRQKWLDLDKKVRGHWIRRPGVVLPHEKHSQQDIENATKSGK